MRITVVGAGGVGGYFGGRLAQAGDDVAFVARGPHLAAIREHGLRVRSVKGDFTVAVTASDDPSSLGPCDVVLFCVKTYATASAASLLAPLLRADSAVVSFQNGVDSTDLLAEVVGRDRVVGGAAYIFSSIVEPGVIAHTGGPARIVLGELNGSVSDRVTRLRDTCVEAGIDCDMAADIRAVLWTKFAFICATAGMTSAVRLPLGQIRDSAESWAMFRSILTEVVSLARSSGVALPPDVVEEQMAFAAGLNANSYSSLHNDLVNGRPMELEELHGTVVRRSAQLGLAAPANKAIYAILCPWARSA